MENSEPRKRTAFHFTAAFGERKKRRRREIIGGFLRQVCLGSAGRLDWDVSIRCLKFLPAGEEMVVDDADDVKTIGHNAGVGKVFAATILWDTEGFHH